MADTDHDDDADRALQQERERARRLRRLEEAAERGNVVAMLALHRIYTEGVTWH